MLTRLRKLVRSRLFRIDHREVQFERRGFNLSSSCRARLEQVGAAFLDGYHAALNVGTPEQLDVHWLHADIENRGFACEGAAMAFGLLDNLLPTRRSRWRAFLEGPGASHRYIVHVGFGWVLARLPWRRRNPAAVLDRFDPLLRWLVMDGFGFHDGYFHWPRVQAGASRSPPLSGYAGRAFDQGLGRSLWFVTGAEPELIARIVSEFRPDRRPDLWSGIGLACAYAGAVSDPQLAALVQACGDHSLHLAQGATFAAEARDLAGIQASHTDRACRLLCGLDAESAARMTQTARANLPPDKPDVPSFEVWRENIRGQLNKELAPCK